jgi:ribonuclease G
MRFHRALQRKVELKSGGHLIIDQTEAMTTIDVNTGGFVGHRNLEETIFKTNLEAAQAIARQLRLRNLGGIIIIDFIDMTETEHQRSGAARTGKEPERDHSKITVSELTSLGLVQITRKRTRESLEHDIVRDLPDVRGPRLDQDRRDRVLRDLSRDSARGAAVRGAKPVGGGVTGNRRPPA